MNPGKKKSPDTFVVSDTGVEHWNTKKKKKHEKMTWFFSLKGTKSTPFLLNETPSEQSKKSHVSRYESKNWTL